jgi:hypothetical protein
MHVDSLEDLAMLSLDELNAVVSDEGNTIELRRIARELWRELIDSRPKAELDKTVIITPDLSRSIVDDD